jgi:hypothetical protein
MGMFCRRASTVREESTRVQKRKGARRTAVGELLGRMDFDAEVTPTRSGRRQREDSQVLGTTRCSRSPQESVREIFDKGCCAQ